MATGTLIGLGIGAMALSAGAAVAAGSMNKSAQESANDTNIQLAREQMAYQTSEREAAQEYNTPANQRQRFEQAGINPYMALGQIDSGNTTMQTGVSPAHVEPVTALGDMIQNLGQTPDKALQVVSMAQQVSAQKEALQQARIETVYKERDKINGLRESMARVAESMSRVSKTSQEYKNLSLQYQEIENQIKFSSLNLRYQEKFLENRNKSEQASIKLMQAQETGQLIQNDLLAMNRAAFPALNQKQLELLSAQTYQAFKSGELSSAMSEREKVKKLGDIIANGIAANQFKLSDFGLNSAELQSLRDGKTLDNLKANGVRGAVNSWIDHSLYYLGTVVRNVPIGLFFGK